MAPKKTPVIKRLDSAAEWCRCASWWSGRETCLFYYLFGGEKLVLHQKTMGTHDSE